MGALDQLRVGEAGRVSPEHVRCALVAEAVRSPVRAAAGDASARCRLDPRPLTLPAAPELLRVPGDLVVGRGGDLAQRPPPLVHAQPLPPAATAPSRLLVSGPPVPGRPGAAPVVHPDPPTDPAGAQRARADR